MGSNHGKRTSFRKVWRFSSRRSIVPPRPMSYTGIDEQMQRERQIPTRPLSMYDAVPFHHLELNLDDEHPATSRQSTGISKRNEMQSGNNSNDSLQRICETNTELCLVDKFDEYDWRSYIPFTLEKMRSISRLNEIISDKIHPEFQYIVTRLLRLEDSDENHPFLEWFFDEFEYFLHSYDDDPNYEHKSLIIRSIEQDRYDCLRYLLDHQLLPSKLDINTMNDQGRHCLLILAHKNGPIDVLEYLLTGHFSCLDKNKLDFNQYSSIHHSCRHFNLAISQILLSHTNKRLLQIENSELHTPLDYWIECLCSLKKLKPTHIQHHSDSLRLDYLLNDADYHANVLFFQTIINHGGQLTKIPLRYIRSILPQLTFEQKLSYVDHHVNLCCTLYKNRLSTLIRDYDNLKISIQAGEILTEFIYALGTVQLEVQTRLAAHAYSSVYENAMQRIYQEDKSLMTRSREHELLQLNMRMLYFKFFRLFQCIYNNPDVNEKNFQFEHIFRRVWIYWKEPVRAFIAQCREKNLSLKSICRVILFKRLNHYPADIQQLTINSSLKQYVAFDNQFFIVPRKY